MRLSTSCATAHSSTRATTSSTPAVSHAGIRSTPSSTRLCAGTPTSGCAIPLNGVVAVAAAVRQCGTVDVYGLSTMSSPRTTCSYYWECQRGKSDAWYHARPGDAAFHDFRGNARTLLRWNASGVIRIRT